MCLLLKRYRYNFIFLISAICFVFQFIEFNVIKFVLVLSLSFLFIYWTVFERKWKIVLSNNILDILRCSILTVFIQFIIFNILLGYQENYQLFIIPFAFSSFCIYIVLDQAAKKVDLKKVTFRSLVPCLYLFIIAFLFTALCSRNSWLYTINDSSDPNIFFSVGKSMFSGKVLYRDIFEQKGFYIYLLHGIGSLISSTTLIGVYWIEVLINFIFIIIGRKIIRLYIKNDWIIFIGIPIGMSIYMASNCFWYGDNAEEICSPFLVYGLYILLKNLKSKTIPSKIEFFMIGVTSGFVLWTKYTMLGFYIGWYVVPLLFMIINKKSKELLISVFWIGCGVFIISIPVLLYFLINNSFQYLVEVYFYDNIFVYSTEVENQSLIKTIFDSILINIRGNPGLSVLVLLSIAWMAFQTSIMECLGYILCIVGILTTTFMGGRYYAYYDSPDKSKNI